MAFFFSPCESADPRLQERCDRGQIPSFCQEVRERVRAVADGILQCVIADKPALR